MFKKFILYETPISPHPRTNSKKDFYTIKYNFDIQNDEQNNALTLNCQEDNAKTQSCDSVLKIA